MLQFHVNEKTCTRCAQCVADCPSCIIELPEGSVPRIRTEKEALCIQCQHCLAVCPTASISILGRKPSDSLPLTPGVLPGLDAMTHLVRGRRSVRRFRDVNVDPSVLRHLLATLANVPTGVNRRELTFTLIDDKAAMSHFREQVLVATDAAAKAGRIPERFGYLLTAASAYREQGRDILFRTAPHALVVSAPPDAPCPQQDVVLALAYFDMLAQSGGLGTVWWGMLKLVLETLPELKVLLGLPADHVYYAMLFGVPAVRYARTVQRDDAAKVRRAGFDAGAWGVRG